MKKFVAYLTAGQRGLAFTQQAAIALIEGGVDILEIGVPFSDPVADGPVIQSAMEDALTRKTSIRQVLNCIDQIKQQTAIPVVLFTYLNPLLIFGFDKLKNTSVDSVLIVDQPYEERMFEYDNVITVITPTTSEKRIETITRHSKHFLYYACRNGTTGVKNDLPDEFKTKIQQIKSKSSLPVVAGFGVSNREMARQVCQYADGFVVGSLFIDAIANGASPEQLTTMAKAIDPRRGGES